MKNHIKILLSFVFLVFTATVAAQDPALNSVRSSCKDCCKDCYGQQLCIHNKCKDCCKDCYPISESCKDCCKDCGECACLPGACTDSYGGVNGKVDLAPAYVHVDILESGKTVHRMNMIGLKADCYYRIWSGLVVKPNLLLARRTNDQQAASFSLGVGFCAPFKQNFCLTPVIGYTWGYMKTKFDRPHETPIVINFQPVILQLETRETFRSRGPFIGLEGSWKFCPCWRVIGSFQYAWSRTKTKICLPDLHHEFTDKSSSKGPSYSVLLEHDLNNCWSINFGAAYNISLSKEKHGLRGAGCKLGLAYWF